MFIPQVRFIKFLIPVGCCHATFPCLEIIFHVTWKCDLMVSVHVCILPITIQDDLYE